MEESKKFEKKMKESQVMQGSQEPCINDFDPKSEILYLKRRITTLEKDILTLNHITIKLAKMLGVNVERFSNDIIIISNID